MDKYLISVSPEISMSLDPLSTIVWSPTVIYKFPLRNATITGTTITVKQFNHNLSPGDVIVVSGSGQLATAAATVSIVDSNRFSYTVASPPTFSTVSPQPGQKTDVWVTCKKYSTLLSYPKQIRFSVASGHQADVQTFDDGKWSSQVTVKFADGLTDVFFDARWKSVRLSLITGTTIPTVISYNANSPAPTPAATTTYHLPIITNGTGGGGSLTPVGTPGTYDIVTTNEFGQVISGSVGVTPPKFTAAITAPSSPIPGDRWLKTDDTLLFTWYVDGDSGQWVEL